MDKKIICYKPEHPPVRLIFGETSNGIEPINTKLYKRNIMKKFDLEDLRFRTSMQKSRVIDYENITRKLLNDPEREQRLHAQECVCCYYIPVMAGQGFTASNCHNCNIELMSSTTSTDKLCDDCAKVFKACKHCGADINLKNRNKI